MTVVFADTHNTTDITEVLKEKMELLDKAKFRTSKVVFTEMLSVGPCSIHAQSHPEMQSCSVSTYRGDGGIGRED